MRKLMTMLTLAAGGLFCVTLPVAEAQETRRPESLAEQVMDMNLTEQEEVRIAEIRKEYGPKVQEAREEVAAILKVEIEKVRALLTPEQLKKVDEMKAERQERRDDLAQRIAHLQDIELTDAENARIQEIHKEYRPQVEKAMRELDSVLTDQQKQTRAEGLKAGKFRREVLASLNLTDAQKEKVAAIAQQLRSVFREQLGKMRAALTEENQAQLGEPMEERAKRVHDRRVQMIVNLKELDLTDEQKTKIKDIREEYRPEVQQSVNKLRGVIREELQAILAVLKA